MAATAVPSTPRKPWKVITAMLIVCVALLAGAMAAQLNSFGPNMLLAKELLLAGERDAVLAYIDACGRFWEHDAGSLWAWRRIINAGGIPNFGAHLMF